MPAFLRDLNIERLSFWIGFLTATLFWFFLARLRPFLAWSFQALIERIRFARQNLMLGTELRLGQDTLRLVQRQHLASPLFALDEIVIQPRCMAPPLRIEPGIQPVHPDITDHALPYLSEWPEMAANYGAPTITLLDALQADANLILTGNPGSGKTVALAYLAGQVLRGVEDLGKLQGRIPFLLHAADLILPNADPENILQVLIQSLSRQVSVFTLPRLPVFCTSIFQNGRALLLLDGLDELPNETIESCSRYVEEILNVYPKTRVVVAAEPSRLGRLPSLGFQPIGLAAWHPDQRIEYLHRWGELWERWFPTTDGAPEPVIINGWLLNDTTLYSPFELTLKTWAAYAGDASGPGAREALEAHIRRTTCQPGTDMQPFSELPETRNSLRRIALQLTLNQKPWSSQVEIESWIAGSNAKPEQEFEEVHSDGNEEISPVNEPEEQHEINEEVVSESSAESSTADLASDSIEPENTAEIQGNGSSPSRSISRHRILSLLLENGLLVRYSGGRIGMAHPILTGYLTAEALAKEITDSTQCDAIYAQEDWTGKQLTLHYFAFFSHSLSSPQPGESDREDPLLRKLLMTSRWLRDAPIDASWRLDIMRRLGTILYQPDLDLGMGARLVSAMALSESPGVDTFFRQMLQSPSPKLLQLGALGAGMIHDTRAVKELQNAVMTSEPDVRRAVCLALVSIGDKHAFEVIADFLLHGDEELRRFAAESLANHIEEGHPMLQEAAHHEDLLVRRASVSGLSRIQQPWARDLLEQIQATEDQWVVQNAASQELEEMNRSGGRLPYTHPPLTETPWLIAFAAEKGIGVVPGKPALDLLATAVQEGNEEEQFAAIHSLVQFGTENHIPVLYNVYYGSKGSVQTAALDCLRLLAARGLELQPPAQFGFG